MGWKASRSRHMSRMCFSWPKMTPRGRLFPIRRVASHMSRLGLTGSYNSRIFNLFAMARKRQFCSWSDLPRDVIDFIVNSLWCVDQIRFRAVCRSWQAANIVKYADKLPWKMGWNAGSCRLYDPSHKQSIHSLRCPYW